MYKIYVDDMRNPKVYSMGRESAIEYALKRLTKNTRRIVIIQGKSNNIFDLHINPDKEKQR